MIWNLVRKLSLIHIYTDGRFDVVLLDVSLPDGNGFEICERIRRTSEVPILFLTAADEEFNVVRGLDMGGDDYVSKPFRLNELLSRIHSLQRRAGKRGKGAGAIQEPVLESGGIRVDLVGNRAWLEAVSYTHLDVYKRQLQGRGKAAG